MFREAAEGQARDPALRGFARQKLPELQQHLTMLQSIQARAGQGGGNTRTSGAAGSSR